MRGAERLEKDITVPRLTTRITRKNYSNAGKNGQRANPWEALRVSAKMCNFILCFSIRPRQSLGRIARVRQRVIHYLLSSISIQCA